MVRNRKVWGVLGLVLALVFVVGYGQGWQPGPSQTAACSVGIGTASPTHCLTVDSGGFRDAIRTKGENTDWGVVIGRAHPGPGPSEGGGHGGRIWAHNPAACPPGSPDFGLRCAAGWYDLFISSWGRHTILNLHLGNVGIGRTDPVAKLHVAGDAYFEGKVGIGVGMWTPLKSKLGVKGLPVGPPPDTSGVAGMLCITNDGNIFIDKSPASPCKDPW